MNLSNHDITTVLIDLVGANIHAHEAIARVVSTLPLEQQGPVAEILRNAIATNTAAFEQLKKSLKQNGQP